MTSKFLFFLFVFLFFQGCSFNLLEGKNPTVPAGTNPNAPEGTPTPLPPPVLTSCPINFVPVPSENSDSSILFCVAKYEMKNVDGKAVSQAPGSPWVNIDRDSSIAACSAMGEGFSLITNNQWWTIARNIRGIPFNWINNIVVAKDNRGLSHGHSDGEPSNSLEASSDDNEVCFGTGETCSQSEWSDQRRIFKLSNGSILWDFAGNVWEWISDKEITPELFTEADINVSEINETAASKEKARRPTTRRPHKPDDEGNKGLINFGHIYKSISIFEQGAFIHGGCLASGQSADIMTIYRPVGSSSDIQLPDEHGDLIGFRCVYGL